jgi:hypothetical protein
VATRELERTRRSAETALAIAERERDDLDAQRQDAVAALATLEGSLSWRVTAPLRAFARRLRR